MSGYSTSFDKKVTVGDLKKFLEQCPDDYLVEVPSLNRCQGSFITVDHAFVDPRDKTVSIDGDISETRRNVRGFRADHLLGEVTYFSSEDAPDWLTSKNTIKGSTYDNRWFWQDHVLTLGIDESVKTDFHTITRIF